MHPPAFCSTCIPCVMREAPPPRPPPVLVRRKGSYSSTWYSATRSDSVVPAVLRPGTYVTTGWQAPSIHPGPCSRALHWWPDMRWEEALTAIRWMSLRG